MGISHLIIQRANKRIQKNDDFSIFSKACLGQLLRSSLRGGPECDKRLSAGVFIFLRPSALARWFPCFRDDKRSLQVNYSVNGCAAFPPL